MKKFLHGCTVKSLSRYMSIAIIIATPIKEFSLPNTLVNPEMNSTINTNNNVLEIINGFNPVRVSGIETQYALSLFDELYVSGYCVTVGYSDALLKNPYFIKYLPYAKSTIKDISCMDKVVNVKYLFSNKRIILFIIILH